MMCFNGYTIKIIFDGDDWMARLSSLPQVSAFGETPEDALDELRIAWEGYVLCYQRNGDKIFDGDEEE